MKKLAGLILLGALAACSANVDETTSLEAANKEKATYCFDLIFNQHSMEAAREECFGDEYIQHNPMADDGVDTIINFLSTFYESNPDARAELKRVAADGDLVWMHYNAKFQPDTLGMAVVDIFRMEDGKLVEHWDVVQPVPETSANDNTMF